MLPFLLRDLSLYRQYTETTRRDQGRSDLPFCVASLAKSATAADLGAAAQADRSCAILIKVFAVGELVGVVLTDSLSFAVGGAKTEETWDAVLVSVAGELFIVEPCSEPSCSVGAS